MDLYVILRRDGWRSGAELEEAAGRSTATADQDMPDDIRWIRSYVLEEGGGSVGTVCIYEASSPEAIRKHASLADLPVTEIIRVADTVIVRPDPGQLAAFYSDVFGWTVDRDREIPNFADGSGHVIGHFVPDAAVAGASGVRPYVYVEDVDETLHLVVVNGGRVARAPYPEGGLRVATFNDPAGNEIGIWTQAGA